MTAMKFQHVKSYIGFKWMFPKTFGSSYRWILVAYQFLSRAHFGVMSIHVSRFVHFKYLFFNILSTHPSMDWLKGKPRGNHRFSHEVWGFPEIFPLDQSIEFLSPLNTNTLAHLWVKHLHIPRQNCYEPFFAIVNRE